MLCGVRDHVRARAQVRSAVGHGGGLNAFRSSRSLSFRNPSHRFLSLILTRRGAAESARGHNLGARFSAREVSRATVDEGIANRPLIYPQP